MRSWLPQRQRRYAWCTQLRARWRRGGRKRRGRGEGYGKELVVHVVVVRPASTLSALSFHPPLVRLCVQAIVASKPGRITSIDTFRGIALCIMMYVEASTTHLAPPP